VLIHVPTRVRACLLSTWCVVADNFGTSTLVLSKADPATRTGPAGQVFPPENRFFKSYQAQVKTNVKHLNVLLFYFSHSTSSIPSNFVCCWMWGKKHTHTNTHKYINILINFCIKTKKRLNNFIKITYFKIQNY
jgi:hypothetical protein